MADPIRPLTLSDLWLPGDVLGGAMLREGARVDVATGSGWAEGCIIDTNGGGEPYVVGYFRSSDGYVVDEYQRPDTLRLDFRRLEVRDRATRVLGPDLLPIHAAELRGDITPGEAAGLVWCSVVRREAGLGVCLLPAPAAGAQLDPLDSMRLAAGYSLREPGGILLLPLPDGVVGRLECSNG